MVPTRALAEIVEHVAKVGAKLVLVGDDRQLPEIGAGGTLGALARRLPAIELRENRRQVAVWEREALAMLRDGDADGAVRRYASRGRIFADEDGDEVRRRLVADWWTAGDPDDAVMIAHRRRDVADLNARAHALMRAAAGALGDEEVDGISVGGSRGDAPQRPSSRRRERGARNRCRRRGERARGRAAGTDRAARSGVRRGIRLAWVRDHRARGAGDDLLEDLRARYRRPLEGVGLRCAESRSPGESAVRYPRGARDRGVHAERGRDVETGGCAARRADAICGARAGQPAEAALLRT